MTTAKSRGLPESWNHAARVELAVLEARIGSASPGPRVLSDGDGVVLEAPRRTPSARPAAYFEGSASQEFDRQNASIIRAAVNPSTFIVTWYRCDSCSGKVAAIVRSSNHGDLLVSYRERAMQAISRQWIDRDYDIISEQHGDEGRSFYSASIKSWLDEARAVESFTSLAEELATLSETQWMQALEHRPTPEDPMPPHGVPEDWAREIKIRADIAAAETRFDAFDERKRERIVQHLPPFAAWPLSADWAEPMIVSCSRHGEATIDRSAARRDSTHRKVAVAMKRHPL